MIFENLDEAMASIPPTFTSHYGHDEIIVDREAVRQKLERGESWRGFRVAKLGERATHFAGPFGLQAL